MSVDPVRFSNDPIRPNSKVQKHKKVNKKIKKPLQKKSEVPSFVQDPIEGHIENPIENPIEDPSFSESSSTTDDEMEENLAISQSATENDLFHMPKQTQPKLPPQRFLDRYKKRAFTPNVSSRLSLAPIQSQPQHFVITRHYLWYSGIKRKVFELTSIKSHEPPARADFVSALSSTLQVLNTKGVICEIDTKTPSGPYTMRIGEDPYLIIQSGNQKVGRSIDVQFLSVNDSKPPYSHLQSPEGICNDLAKAFGERHAIKSVKNAKFIDHDEEIISIRKVSKNRLEIDAKYNILFLHCFCIGLFMFTTK